MSVEAIQKVVAVALITGGIGGGYFALTGGSSGTLSEMHLASGRELITDGNAIAANYKKEGNTDLIEGISREASKLHEKIKKGCERKGSTYYLGPTDNTYRSYVIGCLKEIDLETAFTKQGLQGKEDGGDKKFKKYTETSQTFLTQSGGKKSEPADVNKLKSGCEKQKKERYKYPGDNTEYKARTYCYGSEEEGELENKPPKDTVTSDPKLEESDPEPSLSEPSTISPSG